MKRHGMHGAWLILLVWTGYCRAQEDRIVMRTGEVVHGRLLAETPMGWQVASSDGLKTIPPTGIKLLHFADPVRAAKYYGLPPANSPDLEDVVLLPTEAFGTDLVAGLQAAQKSIYILAYNIGGWTTSPIADVFRILKEKAQAGVEVELVLEFGSSTDKRLAAMVMNFAEYLKSSGIQVLYLQEYKVQHKKVVVVDGTTVWLGSANLTAAAMAGNDEMSACTRAPKVVAAAVADFVSMRKRAKPAEELKY
jgi:hypothetical protein